MLPILPFGSIVIQTPGLALLVGVWIGLSVAEKEAVRLRLRKELIYNLVFFGLIAGIIGARLGFALRFLNIYLDDPLSLFALNPDTLSPTAGFLSGIIVAGIYARRRMLPLRPTLDALAPGLALFLVFIAGAHFLSGDAFGAPTDVPWAIYLWDAYRHPTQIYELVLSLVIFYVIWKRPLINPDVGLNFLVEVSLTAASRLFLEAFRGDSLIWSGGFRAAQLISLMILMGSLWVMRAWKEQITSHKSIKTPLSAE